MKITLADSDATENLGRLLAHTKPDAGVLHLRGEIGAGKSTLVRALLRELGVSGPIKSPTYTLIERYALNKGEAVHLDLYRIAAASELDFLGLDDVAENAALWLVEWPDRGLGYLPKADVVLTIQIQGEGRVVMLQAETQIGAAWLARARSKMAGFQSSS
jgi:tRNA threonylcarbamoyladenosine biosynthesis protein TsaE